MIKDKDVYRIGTITKTHGVNGEVVLSFTDDVFDRVECDYLICKMDGILVPFFMEEYRFKSDTSALIKFERMDDVQSAAKMAGVEVYFPLHLAEQANDGELTWSMFVGLQVVDKKAGMLGKIAHVNTQTINTLFEIEGNKGTLLVPAQEEFLVDLDRQKRVLTVDLPEGLLDL